MSADNNIDFFSCDSKTIRSKPQLFVGATNYTVIRNRTAHSPPRDL